MKTMIYEMNMPDLGVDVRYRILNVSETDALLKRYEHSSEDQLKKAILESVIYNLKTDVTFALRRLSKERATRALGAIYNGCLMLNPALDLESWMALAYMTSVTVTPKSAPRTRTRIPVKRGRKKITKQKFLNLDRHLKTRIIGQDEAIDEVTNTLKRAQAGLNDERRPLGVFLFAGSSGVGKTLLAKEIHAYLFGSESDIVRIDCGEFQHKHENVKLLGSPPGYLGFDEGSSLGKRINENPQTVVLIDEVEKAHSDLWDTFLRIFDEGIMTDNTGKTVDFCDTLIIMTTNLGTAQLANAAQSAAVGFGRKSEAMPNRDIVLRATQKAIRQYFRPEFLNRIDKTITFNNLTQENYEKIAELELNLVQSKLEKRGYVFTFDPAALDAMVREGVSHVYGARGLAQLRRDRIENSLADQILNGRHPRGTAFRLVYEASNYQVLVQRPTPKRLPSTASSSKPRAVAPPVP